MGYAQALDKAWERCTAQKAPADLSVRFLTDTYTVDAVHKTVLSASCNIPAKDHLAIILLHYLARVISLKKLPPPAGEWIDFRRLEGGEGYYAAFKKRAIDVIMRKYGTAPDALITAAERLGGTRAAVGDVGVVIEPVDGVRICIALWRGDDEFAPEANILFDRDIAAVFCTEDIVVLTEIVVRSL